MKTINIEEGIKINPALLIDKVDEINQSNWREIIENLFTPGLFINQNEDGSLDSDFKPEIYPTKIESVIVNKTIKINISALGLASRAYTGTGKIVSLYEPYFIVPQNLGIINPVTSTYYLYLRSDIVGIEKESYLPNYTVSGELKDSVQEYIANFDVLKSDVLPPGDYIKIASFTLDKNFTVTNLVDLRLENRAYLRRELYDWFKSDYLKHDFITTTGHTGVGAGTGVLSYSETELLSGTLSLFSAKFPITRINVIFDGTTNFPTVQIPSDDDYILYVNVSRTEYISAGVINKPLLIEKATTFLPDVDKLVVGVRTANAVPSNSDPIFSNDID